MVNPEYDSERHPSRFAPFRPAPSAYPSEFISFMCALVVGLIIGLAWVILWLGGQAPLIKAEIWQLVIAFVLLWGAVHLARKFFLGDDD